MPAPLVVGRAGEPQADDEAHRQGDHQQPQGRSRQPLDCPIPLAIEDDLHQQRPDHRGHDGRGCPPGRVERRSSAGGGVKRRTAQRRRQGPGDTTGDEDSHPRPEPAVGQDRRTLKRRGTCQEERYREEPQRRAGAPQTDKIGPYQRQERAEQAKAHDDASHPRARGGPGRDIFGKRCGEAWQGHGLPSPPKRRSREA